MDCIFFPLIVFETCFFFNKNNCCFIPIFSPPARIVCPASVFVIGFYFSKTVVLERMDTLVGSLSRLVTLFFKNFLCLFVL